MSDYRPSGVNDRDSIITRSVFAISGMLVLFPALFALERPTVMPLTVAAILAVAGVALAVEHWRRI